MKTATIKIKGHDIKTLYDDETFPVMCLALGTPHSIKRWSNIEYDNHYETWTVKHIESGELFWRFKSRTEAIRFEQLLYGHINEKGQTT